MFQMSLSNVIREFKELLLPRPHCITPDKEGRFPGILIHADCEMASDVSLRKSISFILTGNVSVFCLVQDHPGPVTFENLEKWTNTCNHDECWFGTGVDHQINNLYFDMAEEINQKTGKNIAPAHMHQYVYTCFQFVRQIKVKMKRDENREYFKKLVEITNA